MLLVKRCKRQLRCLNHWYQGACCTKWMYPSRSKSEQNAEERGQRSKRKHGKKHKHLNHTTAQQSHQSSRDCEADASWSYLRQNTDQYYHTGRPLFPPPGLPSSWQSYYPADRWQNGAQAQPSYSVHGHSGGSHSAGYYSQWQQDVYIDNARYVPHHQRQPIHPASRVCHPSPGQHGHSSAQDMYAADDQHHGGQQQRQQLQGSPLARSPARGNIVPFRPKGPWAHGAVIPPDFRDGAAEDARPILLFDLNGTITSHTSKRKSSGVNKPRPGTRHLRRLLEHFRLGVFTSSTYRTVQTAVAMLEEAAGPGPRLFPDPSLILHREQTMEVHKQSHVAAGGKSWDTVKPLHPYFQRLHRVLLLDDDAFKAYTGQEDHMLLIPVWRDNDLEDDVINVLVDVLLEVAATLAPDGDISKQSTKMKRMLWERCGRSAEDEAVQQQQHEDACVTVDA